MRVNKECGHPLVKFLICFDRGDDLNIIQGFSLVVSPQVVWPADQEINSIQPGGTQNGIIALNINCLLVRHSEERQEGVSL